MPTSRLRCNTCGGEVPIPSHESPLVSDLKCRACCALFPLRDGIIEVTATTREEDYPEAFVQLVADVQDKHFWFAARNDIIVSTMRRTVGPLAGKSALEIGCGTGAVLPALEGAGMSVCGIDMHRSALLHARGRVRGPLVWTNATALPFFDDFDVVLLCDVIEHADDDVGLLVEAGRAMKPGGWLVVTVPAQPHLWTRYDEVIGHKRRYTPKLLAMKLTAAGFVRPQIRYFNMVTALVQQLHRRRSDRRNKSQEAMTIVCEALRVPPYPMNLMLRLMARAEAPLSRFAQLKGSSLVAAATRD